MKDITRFTGSAAVLSNFYKYPVPGPHGCVCETNEHAYQAWKTVDAKIGRQIMAAKTPGIAKRMGRTVKLRGDWESLKLGVMKALIDAKFELHSGPGDYLLGTAGAELVEGNDWGDTYWGVCRGRGENWLGRLLMLRRSELYFQL